MSTKIILSLLLVVIALASLPFVLIARSRAIPSARSAPHLVLDMDKQPRFNTQAGNRMFADGRAMRPQLPNTVAQEDLALRNEPLRISDGHPRLMQGQAEQIVFKDPGQYERIVLGQEKRGGEGATAQFVTDIPVPVTADLIRRGQERFDIYCAPCHGMSGHGDGMIQRRVLRLQETNPDAVSAWTPPSNLHDAGRRALSTGQIYNTITHGVRNMPAYDKQTTVLDRWAIVAYVKALQQTSGPTTQAATQATTQAAGR